MTALYLPLKEKQKELTNIGEEKGIPSRLLHREQYAYKSKPD